MNVNELPQSFQQYLEELKKLQDIKAVASEQRKIVDALSDELIPHLQIMEDNVCKFSTPVELGDDCGPCNKIKYCKTTRREYFSRDTLKDILRQFFAERMNEQEPEIEKMTTDTCNHIWNSRKKIEVWKVVPEFSKKRSHTT